MNKESIAKRFRNITVWKSGGERDQEEKALITFLKCTKEGKYARIEKGSLAYPRVKEEREPTYNEEEYYYSLRQILSSSKLLTRDSN